MSGLRHQVKRPNSSSCNHRQHRVAKGFADSCARQRQPRVCTRSVDSRTIGTSPFQPRSPPAYLKAVDPRLQTKHIGRQLGDLGDGDVVARGHVEHLEGGRRGPAHHAARRSRRPRRGCTTCSGDRLPGCRVSPGCGAVGGRSRSRLHASGAARPRSRIGTHLPSGRTSPRTTTACLARQLRRAVGRRRCHRAVVLVRFDLAEVAVDATSGGVEDLTARLRSAPPRRRETSTPCPRRSRLADLSSPWRCRDSTRDGSPVSCPAIAAHERVEVG